MLDDEIRKKKSIYKTYQSKKKNIAIKKMKIKFDRKQKLKEDEIIKISI
jgi:hypothetical protein